MKFNQFKSNLRIVLKFSMVDIKRRFKTSIFSWLWLIVGPALCIFTYWFGLGSISGDQVDTVQYFMPDGIREYRWIVWMLIGTFTWQYCGDMLVSGPFACLSYSWMPKSFGLSPSVPPFIINLSRIITGIPWIVLAWIVAIVVNLNDPSSFNSDVNLYSLEVPVVIILSIIAMNIYSYALSPLASISKDFRGIIGMIPGLLTWITSVFILPNAFINLPHDARYILLQINPFNFIVNGMRSTMLGYSELFTPNPYMTWYSIMSFFLCFAILLGIGYFLNKTSRKFIIDII